MIRPLIMCAALLAFAGIARAQECPATLLNDAKAAIKNASGCQAGIAIYEVCGDKASSYANLGELAREAQERCEKIFLDDLHGEARRVYKYRQTSCLKKYIEGQAIPLIIPKSVCMPYLAEEYAGTYVKLKREHEQNPNPPL